MPWPLAWMIGSPTSVLQVRTVLHGFISVGRMDGSRGVSIQLGLLSGKTVNSPTVEASDEWQAIKTADRRQADETFLADPASVGRFVAGWGAGQDAFLDLEGSCSLSGASPALSRVDGPRSVIWE